METLTGTEWPIDLSEFSQIDMEQIDMGNEAGAASDLEEMNQMIGNLKVSTCRILTSWRTVVNDAGLLTISVDPCN